MTSSRRSLHKAEATTENTHVEAVANLAYFQIYTLTRFCLNSEACMEEYSGRDGPADTGVQGH